MLEYALIIFLGVAYGFIFGLIPIAGATVALIGIYSFLGYFHNEPYLLVAFTTAVVVSCSVGDLFASVVMNIPGGGGSAATMVDGFPMAKKGLAAHALSASIITSTFNGLIWGLAVFLFLPYYGKIVLSFAIPEMLSFLILAFTCVIFVNSHYWFRGILALLLGIFAGLIGLDPITGSERFTGGWSYLEAGIQIVPLMAGLMAMPELIETYKVSKIASVAIVGNIWKQIKDGFHDSVRYVTTGLKGGVIGGAIGLIPGVGGAIVDWLAYATTIASNKNEKIPFGEGNIKGVIGPEGSVLAQKSTAYVPTVLFGIPGAPFEVIVMSLLAIVGLELGTPTLLTDTKFFDTLTYSYMSALLFTFIVSIGFIRYAVLITKVPFKIYFWFIVALITWASVQYTGYWEDYAILIICTVAGVSLKYLKLSRAAFIIGFVLSSRLESLLTQYSMLYSPLDLLSRPISVTLIMIAIVAAIYGICFNRTKISYV